MTVYSLVRVHRYEPTQEVLQLMFCLPLERTFCVVSLSYRTHKKVFVWTRYNQSHSLVAGLPKYGGFSHSGDQTFDAM